MAPEPGADSRILVRRAVWALLATSVAITLVSHLLPEDHQSTVVALIFLLVTYLLVIRGDDIALIRHHGLSLGGLVEPQPLHFRRLGRETARALAWALATSLVVFPPFWLGYLWWWRPSGPFVGPAPDRLVEEMLGQVVAISLPEEAFYRGYLQTTLDDAWPPRWHLLGARVGWGLLVTSLAFAAGHLLTLPHPHRLAVFFPSLLFGWLRNRTGGIGAAIAFHALCNVFSSCLEQGYGVGSEM